MLYPNELRERTPQVVEVLRPNDNVGLRDRRTSVFDRGTSVLSLD